MLCICSYQADKTGEVAKLGPYSFYAVFVLHFYSVSVFCMLYFGIYRPPACGQAVASQADGGYRQAKLPNWGQVHQRPGCVL